MKKEKNLEDIMQPIEHATTPAILPSIARALILPRRGVKPDEKLPHFKVRAEKVKINHFILNNYCSLADIN